MSTEVTVKPKDGNVPHPYNSRNKISLPQETFPQMCGQLRRLIRRHQVTLVAKAPVPDEKPHSETVVEEKPKPKAKGNAKGKKGHQSKPKSTES